MANTESDTKIPSHFEVLMIAFEISLDRNLLQPMLTMACNSDKEDKDMVV